MTKQNDYSVRESLEVGGKPFAYYRLSGLEEQGLGKISKLPFSIKVLLEAAVRQFDGRAITKEHVKQLATWADGREEKKFLSSQHVSCFKISQVFRLLSIWQRCATPLKNRAATETNQPARTC